ncbi:bifunctional riboflavin kinase/FAD synthetase [Robertmurraya korlensis]|uniref:bifunctional riboflavin kinase/FAD synthetase n=1 Tax=Robertmurraya korlensis TaxID=519977 RepID=UPI002041BA17|nr:bifunctional riboflavin kinase/FAD synthetase [Robertmurraya korlensis]
MEVLNITHPHQFSKDMFQPMVVALGYFDGVHLGHKRVIDTASEIAKEKGIKSAVMTFTPHPSVVLKKVEKVEYITPLEEKIKIISEQQVDYLFVVNFTNEFANLLPQEFVDQYLIELGAVHVVAGFDYSYGKLGKGTMETLQFHSRQAFTFTVVPKLESHDEKISSTLIRNHIKNGQLDTLPELLGRYYTTMGIVVHGDKRGRTIGFPTANIDLNEEYILPPLGVHAVRMHVNGKWYEGVCNIGFKPTFNKEKSNRPSVEVHIFDFDDQIYGEYVTIEWHKYLRSEQKFTGIDELVAQIERDKQNSMLYFENCKTKPCNLS